MSIARKICPACEENKIITQYSRNRTASDGLQTYCKDCQSEYQRKLQADALEQEMVAQQISAIETVEFVSETNVPHEIIYNGVSFIPK